MLRLKTKIHFIGFIEMLSIAVLHLELKDGSLHFKECAKGLLVSWCLPILLAISAEVI